jgi:hypothetical protein
MPDDHGSSSDNPPSDETSTSAGTPKPLHGEPPTLPPFSAGPGPRPLTLAGMPAIDFGGADDLFANVPVLGSRPVSAPAPFMPVASAKPGGPRPKVAVPSPPALVGSAAKLAPPPKLSATGKPLGPPPKPPRSPVAAPGETASETTSSVVAPTPTEAAGAKPAVTIVAKPAEPVALSSTSSSSSESELAEALALWPDLEFEHSVGLIDPAEVIRRARERAASPSIEAPPVVEVAKTSGAEPIAVVDDRESPPPHVEQLGDSKVSAITPSVPEPVEPVVAIDSPITRTVILVESAIPNTVIAESHDPTPIESIQSSDSSAAIESIESSESSDPSPPAADTTTNVDGSTPSKLEPAARPMAPPAPRFPIDDRPRMGVPYEPPAVVVRLPVPEQTSEAASASPEPEEPSARGPIALPKPGRPSGTPARAPSPPADAGKVVPLPVLARPHGAPNMIGQEDTGALIDGMADEMVEQARRANAAMLDGKDLDEVEPAANRNHRKWIIGFLLFAVAACLLVALLPDDDADTVVAVGDSDTPNPEPEEPLPAEPESLVQADAPTPTDAPPTEPVPEPTVEPDPVVEEPVADKPKSEKSTKPKSEKSTKPEPTVATTPTPKPAPTPTVDNRDAKQLYDAAKSAYDKGKASEAYKLALASYRKGAKPKTAELMVLAACKLGDKAKASSSLDKVSGLRKPALRKQCKGMGTTI